MNKKIITLLVLSVLIGHIQAAENALPPDDNLEEYVTGGNEEEPDQKPSPLEKINAENNDDLKIKSELKNPKEPVARVVNKEQSFFEERKKYYLTAFTLCCVTGFVVYTTTKK
ncbi:MAG: hypothetical protein NTW22_01635 [Proteobacteria bacterium]|nr:hypothetical protein [Pseudomonadota bacterium]